MKINPHSPKWAYFMIIYGLLMVVSIVIAIVQAIALYLGLIGLSKFFLSVGIAAAVNLSGLILNMKLEKQIRETKH
jgi:hypothetical protein